MADLHKEQLEQQLGDAALHFFLNEYAEADGRLLLSQYEAAGHSDMPETLDCRCKSWINEYSTPSEKGTLLRRTARRAAKAAMIGLVCLYLCTNLILSVEALRVPFLNFCIQTRRVFSSLTIQTGNETKSSTADDDVMSLPISAPNGYHLEVKQHNHDDYSLIYPDSILFLAYRNDTGNNFIIQTLPAAGTFSVDTENGEITEFLLNGMEAIHICKPETGELRTIWMNPERQRIYDVSSDGLSLEAFQQEVNFLSGVFMAPELYSE